MDIETPGSEPDDRLPSEEIDRLNQVLNNPNAINDLPEDLHYLLLMKGAVFTLMQDESPEAVHAILETARRCPLEPIQTLAIRSLAVLAGNGNQPAADSLYTFYLDASEPELAILAATLIDRARVIPEQPEDRAAFLLLSGKGQNYLEFDPNYEHLTAYYLTGAGQQRQRLLAAAHRSHLDHWATIVSTILEDCESNCREIIKRYGGFSQAERNLTLNLLEREAMAGNEAAAEVVCELFIRYEDQAARQAALEQGFLPRQPVERALFYFLAEQWEEYERLDFNNNLLSAAYDAADADLRRRLLALSRYSGQVEWLRSLRGGYRSRWLAEMDDADWELALQRLQESEKWSDLWRLAQAAPPLWAARMIMILSGQNWRPEHPEETQFFENIRSLAAECLNRPYSTRSIKRLRTLSGPVNTMSLSPDNRWLAAGGMDVYIHLWRYPEGRPILDSLIAPAALTRSLCFSAYGEYLIAAQGDNQIRVFRLPESRVVKTFSGHTNLIRAVLLHPDQRTLFSAGFDGSVRAWRFPIGTEIKLIEQSKLEIHALALSPDGQSLISAGSDRMIRVWKWPEGTLVRTLQGHEGAVTALAASTRGPLLASYGSDRVLRIWNYASGKPLNQVPLAQEDGSVTALVFHPDEQAIITGDDRGMIRFRSVSTGKEIAPHSLTEHTKRITAVLLSSPGDQMITSSADGLICMWDLDIFNWIRRPVAQTSPDLINRLQKKTETDRHLPEEKAWLGFTIDLVRWRQRFDVQIGEVEPVRVGEFDIQL